tara:strand:- start:587 stop:1285 length:699 start_codon:yes stop_codon:yes gene_type:complete
MKVPDLFVGKRFFLGLGNPELLGRGPLEVRGSGYLEGPTIHGQPVGQFDPVTAVADGLPVGPTNGTANVMIGQNMNIEMKPIPFYALMVKTFARIKSFLKVDINITARTIKSKIIYTEVLLARSKNFMIPHPDDPNKQLVYACLEGPEHSVYVRGQLRNKDTIILPEVWRNLVDERSITVSLTPVGTHQELIVKRIQDNQIVVGTKPGLPINCYYHIFAERKDIPKLVTEVE